MVMEFQHPVYIVRFRSYPWYVYFSQGGMLQIMMAPMCSAPPKKTRSPERISVPRVSDAPVSLAPQGDISESPPISPEGSEHSPVQPEALTEGGDTQGESSGGAFNPETGEINWDCPCLGGMAHGPCGPQFREAFSCFVHSEADPKGIDCVEKFKAMQDCFREHPDVYGDGMWICT